MTASAEIPPQVISPSPPAAQGGAPAPIVTGGSTQIATPTIAIVGSKLAAAKGRVQVKLACGESECKGGVKIVTITKVRVRRKGKTVTRKRSVVVASGDYEIAPGKTQTVTLELTAKGRRLLAKLAKHHALQVKLTVSVAGGVTKSKTVKLS